MNSKDFYESNEAYIKEILCWVRDWIQLYRKYAVVLDEKGRLKQLKGSITFGNDLELSLEGQMTAEEQKQYKLRTNLLKNNRKQIEKKARNSFRIFISGFWINRGWKILYLDGFEYRVRQDYGKTVWTSSGQL